MIDVHNRYAICTKNYIKFNTVEKSFDFLDDVGIYMVKNQMRRRNLLPFVKSKLVLKLEWFIHNKARYCLKLAGKIGSNITNSKIAEKRGLTILSRLVESEKKEIKLINTRKEVLNSYNKLVEKEKVGL